MEDENQQNNTPDDTPVAAPMEPITGDEEPPTSQLSAPVEAEPETEVVSVKAGAQSQGPVAPAEQPVATPIIAAKASHKKKTNFLAIIIIIAVMAAGVAAWWLFGPGRRDTSQNVSTPTETSTKLGVAVTVADGTVLYQRDGAIWTTVDSSTQLAEGDMIRTGDDGRAVLALDDGSAVRLDADTIVELTSLAVDDVRIEQTTGSVYSRVVPSSRTYTVTVGETAYQALGTAFVTVNQPDNSGVQVYQSSVKSSDLPETIEEGKQYYRANGNAKLEGKVTSIDLDNLATNAFVAWNIAQDEKDAQFKDKLGVLVDVQKKVKEKAAADAAKQAEATKKAAEEKARQEAAAKEKAEKEAKNKDTQKVTRGKMRLSYDGSNFNWMYTGKAVHGYKLVYTTDRHGDPDFDHDPSIYLNDRSVVSTGVPKQWKSGTYYVRVCAYTNNTQKEKCVDYSNTVTVKVDKTSRSNSKQYFSSF